MLKVSEDTMTLSEMMKTHLKNNANQEISPESFHLLDHMVEDEESFGSLNI